MRDIGCPALGKSDGMYSIQNLSTILLMVESAGIGTFEDYCWNWILTVVQDKNESNVP